MRSLTVATLSFLSITGCEWVDNSLRGTFGSPGLFKVETGTELIQLDEGGIGTVVILSLSNASPDTVEASWEILNGQGEFAAHKGTFPIGKGDSSAAIPTSITALADTKLEGNINYTLVISSKSFKNKNKEVTITLRVKDTTAPAVLTFSTSPLHQFTATLVGNTTSSAITVNNSGDAHRNRPLVLLGLQWIWTGRR